MRVISMQGSVVWDILKRDKVYYASTELAREENDYTVDIERLDGHVPIWCYYWPDLSFYTMYNGEVLDYLRMEMSLERPNCWNNFVMFELEIPDNELHIGYSHNASAYSKIFPVLRFEMVRAVYSLKDANPDNPFWKVITPIWVNSKYSGDVITTVPLNCEEVSEISENFHGEFLIGSIGKCLLCGKEVPYIKNGKHFCSLACMWEHKRKFVHVANKENISKQNALQFYTNASDKDFSHGIVKAVRKLATNELNQLNVKLPERPRKYRVVTFQSKEVVDTILQSEVYFADENKLREGSICQEDIDACLGKTPIWVFQHPCFISTNIGYGQWCEMLQTFRQEMSVDSLDGFYMLELLIDKQPPIGKAHNASSLACVIDSIHIDDVAAIYKIRETEHFYFYSIQLVKAFIDEILFRSDITFNKEIYSKDDSVRVKLSDFESAEEYYLPRRSNKKN